MRTGWVIVIALIALFVGFGAGGILGGATGAVGGGLAGVCFTADIAVKEGLLDDAQRNTLLQAINAKHPETANTLQATGDLVGVCKDVLARKTAS